MNEKKQNKILYRLVFKKKSLGDNHHGILSVVFYNASYAGKI
jgi:hypothetical protein